MWPLSLHNAAYVASFAVSGAALVAAMHRARSFGDAGMRRGLVGFFGAAAIWSLSAAVRLASGSYRVSVAMYVVGLVAGLASVGGFLYFASAFAGRSYHLNPRLRKAAVAVFSGATALKVTNPIHGRYFSTAVVSDPFQYVWIQPGALHWMLTAFAYTLAGIGLYLIYETLVEWTHTTPRLVVVFAVLPLPVVLNVGSSLFPHLLVRIYYEPIGVATFGVALLWFLEDRFGSVRQLGRKHLIRQLEFPVALVDDEEISEANGRFARLVGATDRSAVIGRRIDSLSPSVARTLRGEQDVIGVSDGGVRRFYRVSLTSVTLGPHRVATAAVYTDITAQQRQVNELVRQNQEFDNIGEAVAHELRNACAIAVGHIELAREDVGPPTDRVSRETALQTASVGLDRIDSVVDQLEMIMRDSQSVTTRSPVDLEWTAEQISAPTTPPVTVVDDGTLVGNPVRIDHLVENVFELARAESAAGVLFRMHDGELTIRIDGVHFDRTPSEQLLGYGHSVPNASSGMYLPTFRLIAHAHHWDVDAEVTETASQTLTVRIDTDPDGAPAIWRDSTLGDPSDTDSTSDRSPQHS